MKNKGFIFAETIIVLSVVSIGLIMLYVTFSNVLRTEKIKSTYDQTVDIYNLNTIKEYLQAIQSEYPNVGVLPNQQRIVPRGTGANKNINTGLNSLYFRLECQCHDLINAASNAKYGYTFCQDNYPSIYFNYCADLSNHLNVKDIYIIKNNNIDGAISQILSDETRTNNCGSKCTVEVSGKTFEVPRFEPSSNITGIPRRINATLIDYLNTLSPLESTTGENWDDDFIIVGEFYRNDKFYYASLRYER